MLGFWQNETLIAIKAPLGTTLEVPDPDEVILILSQESVSCYVLLPPQIMLCYHCLGPADTLGSCIRQWSILIGDSRFCFAAIWGPLTCTLSGS